MIEKIKGGLVKLLILLFTTLGIFVTTFLAYAILSVEAAFILSGILLAIGLVTKQFKLASQYVNRNSILYPLIFVGGFCCIMFYVGHSDEEEERLTALRTNDPAAYLTELKEDNEEKWFEELEELDPVGYGDEVARRAQVKRADEEERLAREVEEEQKRAAEKLKIQQENQDTIDALLTALDGISEDNTDAYLTVYEEIVILDPNNDDYKLKLAEFRQKKWEADLPYQHPEMFIKIRDIRKNRSSGIGYGTLSFKITNELDWDVQDPIIACDYIGRSGTVIQTNVKPLFDIIPAKGTIEVLYFDMGYEPGQTVRRECKVANAG